MLSIVIPAKNEEDYIEDCILSILNQVTRLKNEVIVVNNNSSDKTVEKVKKFPVKLLHQKKAGVSAARNLGALHAQYDTVVFFDADCRMPNTYLDTVERIISADKNTVAFGGPYRYEDAGFFVRFVTTHYNYFFFYSKIIQFIFGVPVLSGGNMIVRKKVFQKLGGFDETITTILFPEDLDLCKRYVDQGYKIKMSRRLPVTSSFRRQLRRTVIADAITRWFNTLKILLGY